MIVVRDLRGIYRTPYITPIMPRSTSSPVLITVIIPARNEVDHIGRCLAGLVSQRFAHLEILVLDDGSTDGTSDVVRSFTDQLPGLRLLQGEPLPSDWSGKCWACWQAAQHSSADWLLFLDADTIPQRGMIHSLLGYAQQHQLDMLTLLTFLELGSFWERVLLPPFFGLVQLVYPADRVNDPCSSLALANGQCILVRREAYAAVDGHRAVRDSVLEDVHLAQIIKRAGFRIAVAAGPELLHVRMYTNRKDIFEGLRKNAIAGFRSSGSLRSLWSGFKQAFLTFWPFVLLFGGIILAVLERDGSRLLLLFGFGLLVLTLTYWGYMLYRLRRINPFWAILYPFGTWCYFALVGVALWRILSGRGVTWKGRTYTG
jgi:chlorobactene glucosyltransferase